MMIPNIYKISDRNQNRTDESCNKTCIQQKTTKCVNERTCDLYFYGQAGFTKTGGDSHGCYGQKSPIPHSEYSCKRPYSEVYQNTTYVPNSKYSKRPRYVDPSTVGSRNVDQQMTFMDRLNGTKNILSNPINGATTATFFSTHAQPRIPLPCGTNQSFINHHVHCALSDKTATVTDGEEKVKAIHNRARGSIMQPISGFEKESLLPRQDLCLDTCPRNGQSHNDGERGRGIHLITPPTRVTPICSKTNGNDTVSPKGMFMCRENHITNAMAHCNNMMLYSRDESRDPPHIKQGKISNYQREGTDVINRTINISSTNNSNYAHHPNASSASPNEFVEDSIKADYKLEFQESPSNSNKSVCEKKSNVTNSKVIKGSSFNANKAQSGFSTKLMLLALPEDKAVLSESLCIIRENVEVFCATIEDVNAPAPGRKNSIAVGQVGIRCIHCSSEKVKIKRATCYPSSMIRIYRTVTDMKLDHFDACPHVPLNIKSRLNALKTNNTRSTIATMRYFVDSAKKLGLVDTPNGIRMSHTTCWLAPATSFDVTSSDCSTLSGSLSEFSFMSSTHSADWSASSENEKRLSAYAKPTKSSCSNLKTNHNGKKNSASFGHDVVVLHNSSMSSSSSPAPMNLKRHSVDDNKIVPLQTKTTATSQQTKSDGKSNTFFAGRVSLSLPEDKFSLSPLRCFLREHIYAFSATAEDIAVRTPTSFSVVLGQVGIACVHCYSLPPKKRSNRAICFPFSIGRIYQSVADMQRFHFSNCNQVPQHLRAKFLSLQSASSKGSKGLATRQYWVTAARKLGLNDTPNGIRFGRDPNTPVSSVRSLDILAQVASNVMTNDPLVLPEDKPLIAEFLYLVMEQLHRCRFTEADRNKRRLKDVGYTGVECKHCARQVDGRKFFWSSVNAVESNFVSVHTHMMKCRMVPEEIKLDLERAKKLRKEQTARLQTGSQKAFFSRVWKRLHQGRSTPESLTEMVET